MRAAFFISQPISEFPQLLPELVRLEPRLNLPLIIPQNEPGRLCMPRLDDLNRVSNSALVLPSLERQAGAFLRRTLRRAGCQWYSRVHRFAGFHVSLKPCEDALPAFAVALGDVDVAGES